MASRVVNSRISEPADTKMSVEEMTSLSRYLYVLKHGYNKDSKSTSDNEEDTHTTTDGTTTPATSNQPPITGLFEEEELGDTSNNRDQGSNEHDEETSPLLSPSEPKRKRNLSSLGNIFPFAPLDRMPSLSRSGSEIACYCHLRHTNLEHRCLVDIRKRDTIWIRCLHGYSTYAVPSFISSSISKISRSTIPKLDLRDGPYFCFRLLV